MKTLEEATDRIRGELNSVKAINDSLFYLSFTNEYLPFLKKNYSPEEFIKNSRNIFIEISKVRPHLIEEPESDRDRKELQEWFKDQKE